MTSASLPIRLGMPAVSSPALMGFIPAVISFSEIRGAAITPWMLNGRAGTPSPQAALSTHAPHWLPEPLA